MRRPTLRSSEKFLVFTSISMIFCAQLAIGGENNGTALLITLVFGIISIVISAPAWGRKALMIGMKRYFLVAFFFLVTILAGLISLTEVNSDPTHKFWDLVRFRSSPSIDHSRTILELIKLMSLGTFFFIGLVIGGSRLRVHFFLKVYLGFSIFYAFVAITAFIYDPSTIMNLNRKLMFEDRLTASFSSPNTAGTFLGTCLLLATGTLFFQLAHLTRAPSNRNVLENVVAAGVFPILAILVNGLALIMTASRAAILIFMLCLLILSVTEAVSRRWNLKINALVFAPTISLSIISSLLASTNKLIVRLNNLGSDAGIRKDIYLSHMKIMKSSPLTGFGLGSFTPINRNILNKENYEDLWLVRAMHNVYMEWVEAAGWLGALPIFLCIFTILIHLTYGALRIRSISSELWLIITVSIFILGHALTDFALEDLSIAGWWAMLLGLGLGLLARQEKLDAPLAIQPSH